MQSIHKILTMLQALWLRVISGDTKQAPPLSKRAQLEQDIRRLDTTVFIKISPISAQGIWVTVPFRTIDIYTMKLREAAIIVTREALIGRDWLSPAQHESSLDSFLATHDGFYQDTGAAISMFHASALQLCIALKPADELGYGPFEHNLRMLEPLLKNISQLTLAIQEAIQ
jgi:hypothetical protein